MNVTNKSETDAEPTPGPWQADVDHQPNETPLIIAHTKPEGNAYIVAEVNQNGLLEGDWKANARLIAAAPIMKERLLRLNTTLSWYLRPDVDRSPDEDNIREMFQWTEDALASAEGSGDE
jgi:hypothetical protein